MINDNCKQRSIDWFRLRCGCVTGSKVVDIMSSGKKKEDLFSQVGKGYLYQVAGERLFNPTFLNDDDIFQDYINQTSFTTKAMQWGADMEEQGRACFAQRNPGVEIA